VIGAVTKKKAWASILFGASSLAGLLAFSWPFLTPIVALPHGVLVSIAATVATGAAIALLLMSLSELRDPRTIALIGVLAALAAAARMLSVGAGGIEFIFVIVILTGRVLGTRAGFAVGALGIAVSSMMWGGFGPWTPFQMFAVGWVGVGAGLLMPRTVRVSPRIEVAILGGYGAIASYLFGALMNLWFWPLAIGSGTSLSLVESDGLAENVARFVAYSLATSTVTWDTVRAITTVATLMLMGAAALTALRRVVRDETLDRKVLGLRVVEHERVG
jgi:hypothetical protein